MSVIQKEIEQATELAVSVVFGAAAKVVKKEKLEKNQLSVVGQAIGTLVFVTAKPDGTSIVSSFSKPQEVDATEATGVVGQTAPAAGGRRRRGGVIAVPSLITMLVGALGILFAATTGSNIVMTKAELDEVIANAKSQITAACPLNLQMGPPVQRLIDWRGENARALRTFKASEATCNAVKVAQQARIAAAQAELQTIVSLLPDRVALLSTGASIAAAGPAGFTPAGLTSATAVGAAMRQVTTAVIEGVLPKDLTKFAKDLSTAFPIAQPEAAAAAPEEVEEEEPAPTRSRRGTGGRKTKKRAPKRRTTFRRRKFVY